MAEKMAAWVKDKTGQKVRVILNEITSILRHNVRKWAKIEAARIFQNSNHVINKEVAIFVIDPYIRKIPLSEISTSRISISL